MKIALIGASGFIGSALRDEALARGHHVTALTTSPGKIPETSNLDRVAVDVMNTDALTEQLRGHDLVISAFSGHAQSDVRGYYMKGMRSIVSAARKSGRRLLVVGGAGSLYVAPGVQLLDSPDFPAQWKASAEGARDALRLLLDQGDLDWTMLSPSAQIVPGARSGQYRLGGDDLLVGADGQSRVTTGDFAAAMLDEAERPAHWQRRFTVGS